jgi:peptidoglycan/xylan/chitin deacetylase (PgdA/CDA1 family)
MKTRVFITIDTEFSIGGALAPGRAVDPLGVQNVLCEIAGRSEGLGFMLDTFGAHGVKASFFVETLQTAFFGDEPMGHLVRRIAAAGHDLQLHLHPVWTYFDRPDWRQRLAIEPPNDNLHGQSVERLVGLIQRGLDTFERWQQPRPVALRTGNLMVDRNVYLAMAQAGLAVASNVARAVFEPAEQALQFNAGIRLIEGVQELPVLTYADVQLGARTHRKALTVTGSSFAETRHLLEAAAAAEVPSVVLLTHCHEFVKGDMRGELQADRVNQRRLESVCAYLASHTDRFEVCTMQQMAHAPGAAPSTHDPLLAVPLPLALLRAAQNKLNELNLL